MRLLALGWTVLAAVLGLASGCGHSEGDSATPGGAGNGTTTAGSSSAGASAGKAGMSATAAAASGGSSSGGSAAGGSSGGVLTTGGQPDAQAGADSNGAGGLVDCDPKKILCKRAAPVCDAGQVPSVQDSCYGDCVKIERCGCSAADQCPQPEEYTCWAKQHCGYYVQ